MHASRQVEKVIGFLNRRFAGHPIEELEIPEKIGLHLVRGKQGLWYFGSVFRLLRLLCPCTRGKHQDRSCKNNGGNLFGAIHAFSLFGWTGWTCVTFWNSHASPVIVPAALLQIFDIDLLDFAVEPKGRSIVVIQ